jgi:hypothetical protein
MLGGKAVYATMGVELQGGEALGDVRAYRPGEAISGSVTITPEDDMSAEGIRVSLNWFTSGKPDSDRRVMDKIEITGGVLTRGVEARHDFHFTLPDAPWSYQGHYVNVNWAITIEVLRKPARLSLQYDHIFILSPTLKLAIPAVNVDSLGPHGMAP